jgi:DNA-binding FrmR family transcriptional regulator
MMQAKIGEKVCHDVLAQLDSFIDNRLPTRSKLEMLEHFENCVSCAREKQDYGNIRTRLQSAVRDVRLPVNLEERVRDRLRQERPRQVRKLHLMAIAAALAICAGSWLSYRAGMVRPASDSAQSYVAAVTSQVSTIMRVGLGDHLHCAVLGGRKNTGAIDSLPAEVKELIPIVQRYAPAEFRLTMAHECRYDGRKFIHLTLQSGNNLLSLVVARKRDGESLTTANVARRVPRPGLAVYTAGARQFQVAAFEYRDFLVYTVSDLSPQRNLDVLEALAPAIQTLLNQMAA